MTQGDDKMRALMSKAMENQSLNSAEFRRVNEDINKQANVIHKYIETMIENNNDKMEKQIKDPVEQEMKMLNKANERMVSHLKQHVAEH